MTILSSASFILIAIQTIPTDEDTETESTIIDHLAQRFDEVRDSPSTKARHPAVEPTSASPRTIPSEPSSPAKHLSLERTQQQLLDEQFMNPARPTSTGAISPRKSENEPPLAEPAPLVVAAPVEVRHAEDVSPAEIVRSLSISSIFLVFSHRCSLLQSPKSVLLEEAAESSKRPDTRDILVCFSPSLHHLKSHSSLFSDP